MGVVFFMVVRSLFGLVQTCGGIQELQLAVANTGLWISAVGFSLSPSPPLTLLCRYLVRFGPSMAEDERSWPQPILWVH